jgi:hypothetical protein
MYTNFTFLHLIDSQFSLFRNKFSRIDAVCGYKHKLLLLCCAMRLITYGLLQGWTNPWLQIDLATTLCKLSPRSVGLQKRTCCMSHSLRLEFLGDS